MIVTLQELKAVLERTGLPIVYDFWPMNEAPELPWICYRELSSANLFADGQVYFRLSFVDIDLYVRRKDPDSEALVEAALDGAGLCWEKTETFVQSEDCYQIKYQIEV